MTITGWQYFTLSSLSEYHKVVILFPLKVLVLIHNFIPKLFFFSNIWGFWYQMLSHIYVWSGINKNCLREISEWKPSWKWENMVTFYKTISNINIVSSNYLQMRYNFFFTLDDNRLERWPNLTALTKIHFPKLLEATSLIIFYSIPNINKWENYILVIIHSYILYWTYSATPLSHIAMKT